MCLDMENGSFSQSTGRVKFESDHVFRLSDIKGRFNLGRVDFNLGRLRINRFLVQCLCYANISNFVENFRSGTVRFGLIRVLGLLLDEPISNIGLVMGLGCSVHIFNLGLILSGLNASVTLIFCIIVFDLWRQIWQIIFMLQLFFCDVKKS